MNNNHFNPNQYPASNIEYIYDEASKKMIPIVTGSAPQQAYSFPPEQPSYAPEQVQTPIANKNKRRRYTAGSKWAMGGLATMLIVTPPAAHMAAEWATSMIMNAANPAPDKPVTPEDLVKDMGVSIAKMTGGSK